MNIMHCAITAIALSALVLLTGCRQSMRDRDAALGPSSATVDANRSSSSAQQPPADAEPVAHESQHARFHDQSTANDGSPAHGEQRAMPDDDSEESQPRADQAEGVPGDVSVAKTTTPSPPVRRVEPFPGITVVLSQHGQSSVEVAGEVCIEAGWLEQIACSPNTREHEALVVVKSRPSHVHAALLMAGFEAGSPGRWTYEDNELHFVEPKGDPLAITVRYITSGGENGEPMTVEHDIRQWIMDAANNQGFPSDPWIFAGSLFRKNPPSMGPGEHYVADMTGSLIGLVTFGDEVIGFSRVLADQVEVQAPEWQANTAALPPIGTPVTLVIQRADREP